MVNIDPEKLIFIVMIAVVVLGPERLPQAARTIGRALGEVRRYTSSFQSEVRQVLAEPKAIVDAAVHDAEMRSYLHRNGNGPEAGKDSGPPLVSPGATGRAGAAGAAASAAAAPSASAAVSGRAGASEPRAPAPVPGTPDDPTLN